MSKDSSNDSPRKITDDALIAILKEADSPILKTKEIAKRDDVPIGPRQIENRLKSLEKQNSVGSRIIIANPEARIWWHKGIELRHAWPSQDDPTEVDDEPTAEIDVGVEAVDVLDSFSGRDETLRKRREAINAVFKYLFDNEAATASELRLVGWGADMDTFESPESLWNNCLKKAFRESYFFTLQQSQKEWQMSDLGLWLKEKDEQGLWNNWESHKKDIESMYHDTFLSTITSSNDIEKIGPYTFRVIDDINKYPTDFTGYVSTTLDMDGPVWACKKGTLSVTTVISGESDRLSDFFAKQDVKESELDFDVTWEDNIDSGEISITRFRDIEFDVSSLIRQTDSNNLGTDIERIKEWGRETPKKIATIL